VLGGARHRSRRELPSFTTFLLKSIPNMSHRRGTLGPPSSGSANLDVLAPDRKSLREEFEHWRLQEDHFGWAASSGILHRLAARERYRRGSPFSKKIERDLVIVLVGRRRRCHLIGRSAKPAVTDRGEDGVASIGPHVFGEGAARRHGSDRSCSAGPPCGRAPWAGLKQASEDET